MWEREDTEGILRGLSLSLHSISSTTYSDKMKPTFVLVTVAVVVVTFCCVEGNDVSDRGELVIGHR